MKVLTVAVPVYNTEKYLKRCFDSLLIDEVLNDIEIVTVNDGSKDGSLALLKEYGDKYPETVVVVDKENGGHGSAVNAALDKASGKYFRVLDSDDWVSSEDFVRLVKKLREEVADLVITNYSKEFVYDGRTEKNEWKNLEDGKEYIFDEINLELLDKEYFVMANSVYKTDVLKQSGLRLMEKTFYVDMQFNVVPITRVRTFRYYDLDIYRYFIGRPDQSMNLDNFIRNRTNHEKVVKFIVEFYTGLEKELSDNKKDYIRLILFYILRTHYYIYCYYPKKGSKEMYKEIKAFDVFLKNKDLQLYKMMNSIGQIRYNRKLKFIFVKISPRFFSRLVQKVGTALKKKGLK